MKSMLGCVRTGLPFLVGASLCYADGAVAPTAAILSVGQGGSQAIGIVLSLTMIALLPGLLVATTVFTRIIIVLSMLRHAIGMQETPPNVVLIGLAMFLTLLSMGPTFTQIEQQAFTPLLENKIQATDAMKLASEPLKTHMISQTREQDMAFILDLADQPLPEEVEALSLSQVVPAYMLSELRTAFTIGFMIFLPFLLVDIVVSGVLMSMGMMMMPPMTIALPIKILLFVLIDGWTLVIRAILSVGL